MPTDRHVLPMGIDGYLLPKNLKRGHITMDVKGKFIVFCGSGNSGTGTLSEQGVLRHLENVSVYSSAYDCLMNESFLPGEITAQEKDFCDFLRGIWLCDLSDHAAAESGSVVAVLRGRCRSACPGGGIFDRL